jgi:hypothetical protein
VLRRLVNWVRRTEPVLIIGQDVMWEDGGETISLTTAKLVRARKRDRGLRDRLFSC